MTHAIEVEQRSETFAVTTYQPFGDHHGSISAHGDSKPTRPELLNKQFKFRPRPLCGLAAHQADHSSAYNLYPIHIYQLL